MDFHTELLLDQYQSNQSNYEVIFKVAKEQILGIIDSLGMIVNSVEGRVKKYDSLKGKLLNKGDKYASIFDVTDIVGLRIVTFYEDEVNKVAAALKERFKLDFQNSVDKRKQYNVDQFGYKSLHFICTIPANVYEDKEHPEINTIRFEVQIRSVLQHVWATIYHDTGYKSDVEIPQEYLRSLNQLAGLLELADDKFVQIRTSLDEYRRNIKKIVRDGNLNEVELTGDSYKAYMHTGIIDKLNQRIATINNMEIEVVSFRRYLAIFKNLNITTLGELDAFFKENLDDAYEFCVHQFEGKDIDIITSFTGVYAILCVAFMKRGYGKGGLLGLLEFIYGARKNNESVADSILKIGEKMGLLEVK